jgi:hypothetical protein
MQNKKWFGGVSAPVFEALVEAPTKAQAMVKLKKMIEPAALISFYRSPEGIATYGSPAVCRLFLNEVRPVKLAKRK